jgi:hypothetical protein
VHYALEPQGQIKSFVLTGGATQIRRDSGRGIPFGGEITDRRTFSGLTIPSKGRVGWLFGTDRWPASEFFRYEITRLQLPS